MLFFITVTGCFQDNIDSPVFSAVGYISEKYATPDVCGEWCRKYGFDSAAIEDGNNCLCAMKDDVTGKKNI